MQSGLCVFRQKILKLLKHSNNSKNSSICLFILDPTMKWEPAYCTAQPKSDTGTSIKRFFLAVSSHDDKIE